MTGWNQDLRLAHRALGRRPGFGVRVVAIAAVGSDSSAALSSLVDACLVKSDTDPVVGRWDAVWGPQPASARLLPVRPAARIDPMAALRNE